VADYGGDSLMYVVAAKGTGLQISQIAVQMKYQHDVKGNSCSISYLTDSASLNEKKGVLFLNSRMPNIEEDFLTKGYFGQFSSKQVVSYLLVSYDDVDKYFVKKK